jgi:glycosyltransferase involved in cell wall biosynthesis
MMKNANPLPINKMHKTLVVIPAYNEERSVGAIVRLILKNKHIYQCVVVDDGSTDHTSSVARKSGAHVIRLRKNNGTGAAISVGLRYAVARGAGRVVLLDADGQHDPKYITALTRQLGGSADLVIGSRYIISTPPSTSFSRRAGTWVISLLFWILYRHAVADPTSGFRAMNTQTARFLVSSYSSVFPEPETLLALARNKYAVKEVSVQMKKRLFGHSSIRPLRALYLMIYITGRMIKRKLTG